MTDEELMTECARGVTSAFEALFVRYRVPVWGFFRRRMDDAGRAEELAQETFVALLKGRRRYRSGAASFRTYLYAIARNLLMNERRRAARPTVKPLNGHIAASAAWAADAGFEVRDAVGRLDDMDREVLMLREFEQLSYAEIATLLDVPTNTVRSRLFRARAALHDLLMKGTNVTP
jgi:RNA polymerase sigma-70 factor (ECF subfamily)